MFATYEPIASTTLGSSASSVTFSGIASSWTDLILVTNHILDSQSGDGPSIRINSDTGSNYSVTAVYGSPDGAGSVRESSQTRMRYVTGSSSTTRNYSINQFANYANANVFKTVLSAYGTGGEVVLRGVGLWRSTSAITSITIEDPTPNNFASGSTFSLYGIKAA